jgi:predicted XRE-type DNA-binding protein
VFADLDLPNADQELTKARLTLEIARIIKDRGLTQVEAAKILGFSSHTSRRLPAIVRDLSLSAG